MSVEKISIIVPVYNVENYLAKCVESILNQTYKNIEVILVNDGSKDTSGDICDYYAKKDNRVKVIHIDNGGVSNARNTGLNIASGKYVGFVDSDDYIKIDMYENLYKLLVKNKADIAEIDFILTNEAEFSRKIRKSYELILSKKNAIKYFLIGNSVGNNVVNKLFTRESIRNIRFLNKAVGEDMYFVYQAIENVEKIVVNTKYAGYYYIIRENSAMNECGSKKNLDNVELSEKIYINIQEKLKEYALAKVLREKMKSIQKLMSTKDEELKKHRDKYLDDVKNYPLQKAIKYLSKKHVLTIFIMKLSPKLYDFLYKKFQKQ